MSASETEPAIKPAQEDAFEGPNMDKPLDAPDVEASKTEEHPLSLANEFDPIVPELRPGGAILLGEEDLQYSTLDHTGVKCTLRPVKTRQLLRIGRILTGSARPLNIYGLIEPYVEADDDASRLAAIIAAVTTVFLTVPNSEDEFLALLANLVQPTERLDENEVRDFVRYMDNPTIIDTAQIILQLVANEQPRAVELGKALMIMFPALVDLSPNTPE